MTFMSIFGGLSYGGGGGMFRPANDGPQGVRANGHSSIASSCFGVLR
jgi:hypothetical protein